MEIVQRHLQDALCHSHTGRFLHGLGVVLEKEPRQQKRSAGGDDAPGHGFGQVADAGFFSVGHGEEGVVQFYQKYFAFLFGIVCCLLRENSKFEGMPSSQKPSQMRLLFLSDGLAPFVTGGMQQHSALLVKYLAPLVQHITLLHCGPLNGDVPDSKEVSDAIGNPSNVRIIGVPFVDRGKLPGHYLRASKRLSQAYCDRVEDLNGYDGIYAQGLTGNAFLGKHPKVMVNLHGLEMFQPGFTVRERLSKYWIRPLFRKQLAQSWRSVSLGDGLTQILLRQGLVDTEIAVIPNGIDAKWILSKKELESREKLRNGHNRRFVMIGRNEFRKGLHVLQKAMDSLKEPIELHMIGAWPQWDAGIHKVIHHGVIRDKAELMARLDECDVLLLPSLSEGMPTVILEAMARGLAVVATDVGACSELIPITRLLPPGNASALAQAISDNTGAPPQAPLQRFTFAEIAKITLTEFEENAINTCPMLQLP